MSTKELTPFMAGHEACEKGKSVHSSPYPEGSRERTKWVNGWQWAAAQAKKAADKAAREAIDRKPLPDWATAQEATK